MSHSVYDYVEDSTDYNSVVTEHSRKTLCENTKRNICASSSRY